MGYIHNYNAGTLTYEPSFSTNYTKLYFAKVVLTSSDATPIRTIVNFLRENPQSGDYAYERNAEGAYVQLGQITNIEGDVYTITIGGTPYLTSIKSLSSRSLNLSLKCALNLVSVENTEETIYLPSLRPEAGALIRVRKENPDKPSASVDKIYAVTNITVVTQTNTSDEMKDKPAWWPSEYEYITINATDVDGNGYTFTITDSRRATTNEYLVKLTNITEVPEKDITSTHTEIKFSIEEVDVETNTSLQTIATYSRKPSSIGHFGRLLIVRDDIDKVTHFYMYSNGAYSPYISNSDNVRCDISVKESIDSPQLTIVPIPTDAKDNDDDGYVRYV